MAQLHAYVNSIVLSPNTGDIGYPSCEGSKREALQEKDNSGRGEAKSTKSGLNSTVLRLGAARSKSYSYAAHDLLRAGQVAERVTDWHGFPDHAAFMRQLRQEHGRKYSFWPLLEGQ